MYEDQHQAARAGHDRPASEYPENQLSLDLDESVVKEDERLWAWRGIRTMSRWLSSAVSLSV